MKVINRTKYPSKMLRHLASIAGSRVPRLNRRNCTVVFVTGKTSHGVANRNHCKVFVPSARFISGYIETAQQLFTTAVHELKHIADNQNNLYFGEYNKRWANRSHEQRAIVTAKKAESFAEDNLKGQDEILAFAIEFEKQKKAWYEKNILRGYSWREYCWNGSCSLNIFRFFSNKMIEYWYNWKDDYWERLEYSIERYHFSGFFVKRYSEE